MKNFRCFVVVWLAASLFSVSPVFGDRLIMSDNSPISGTAIQTNGNTVLVLTRYATFNFKKADIKEIKAEPSKYPETKSTNRLQDFNHAVLLLSKQSWATNLSPIPATVIDKGILRNVPYSSFRCGEDYEVNVYGELDHLAGIEIGVYRKLLEDNLAKSNCVKFIGDLLDQPADKEILKALDLKKDLKTYDDVTFEITPPTSEDAYNGWWISVYSEQKLNFARASDKELKQISITKTDAAKEASQSKNPTSWSADDLKLARPSQPMRISFTSPSSGLVVSNAEVVRIVDGANLIWRTDNGAVGMVRLADLPEELRVQFGYDPVKTAAADEAEKERRAKLQRIQTLAAQSAQPSQPVQSAAPAQYSVGYPQFYGSDNSSSSGGSVYVRGYTRQNGTYVQPHYRSR